MSSRQAGRVRIPALARTAAMLVLSVAALASAFAAVVYWRVRSRAGMPEFPPVLLWQLAVWAPWILLAPAVRGLSVQFPIHRLRVPGWLAFHATASLLAAAAHLLWYFLVSDAISPYHGLPGTKYGAYAWFFIFWYLLDLVLYWTILAFARGDVLARETGELGRRIAELEEILADVRPPDSPQAFAVRKNGRRHVIQAEDVRWIEAQDYFAALHTAAGTFLLRESLATLARRLDGTRFVRIHRSTIANLQFVRGLETDAGGTWFVTLADGTRRRVSRAGRRQLRERLAGRT